MRILLALLTIALLAWIAPVAAQSNDTHDTNNSTSPPANTENGPYLNGGLGATFFEETNSNATTYSNRTNFATRAGIGYTQETTDTKAPIFIGAEGNVSYYGKWRNKSNGKTDEAYSIDALAIFGLQLKYKARIYGKAGLGFFEVEQEKFAGKIGAGISWPIWKTIRLMAEVDHAHSVLEGTTTVIGGIQYYF